MLITTPKIKPFFMQLQKHCYLKFSINLFDFNNFEMLQKPALYVETMCVYQWRRLVFFLGGAEKKRAACL